MSAIKKIFLSCLFCFTALITSLNSSACKPSDSSIVQSTVVAETSATTSSVSLSAGTVDSSTAVKAGITVKKVDNLSPNFINGVDVSSYLSEIKSGAIYYDFDGKEADLFDILKEAGVNYVRIRLWNCPFKTDNNGKILYTDKKGKEYNEDFVKKTTSNEGYPIYKLKNGTEVYPEGYGAGNCDIDNAKYIGKKATEHGMKVLIDFHYSDFWADPNKQKAPKAWDKMNNDKEDAAAMAFTTSSLKKLTKAGVNIGMVQIGNEINNGVAGLTYITDVYPFLSSCAKAVRKFDKNILIAVHYTNPQNYGYQANVAQKLADKGVDYDVFATSYYPFWHGTCDSLLKDLQLIIKKYNKKVMVAETSYAWTMSDGDGYGNNVNSGATDQTFNYIVSVEGQAQAVRDTIATVAKCGNKGLGVFYWEPAWIPVDRVNWNRYGSGWASKYAKGYDPEVHDDYNGATWDNQAYFDFNGKALESLKVYQYVKTGAIASK